MRITIAATLAALLLTTPATARNANYSGECDNCSNQSSYSASGTDIITYSKNRHKDLARLKAMARLNRYSNESVGTSTCNCSTGGNWASDY